MRPAPPTHIDDLPDLIQEDLGKLLKVLRDKAPAKLMMAWLYGSYARGDYINRRNVYPDGLVTEYHSDLDILLVIDQEGQGQYKRRRHKDKLRKTIKESADTKTKLHIVFVEMRVFDRALEEGHYFYEEVLKEGRLLFDRGHPLPPQKGEHSPKLRRRKSKAWFMKFYPLVVGFKRGVEFYYQISDDRLTMLNLHQMSEHLFHVLDLVFTDYKMRSHDLNELLEECGAFFPELVPAMRPEIPIEIKQWGLLQEAYVNARYDEDWFVEHADVEALIEKIARLQDMIYHAAVEKISSFLPQVPFIPPMNASLLNFEDLKNNPIPEAELALQKKEMEKTLKQVEEITNKKERALMSKEKALKREKQALLEKEQERLAKEEALQQVEEVTKKEEQERLAKEEALVEKEEALQQVEEERLISAEAMKEKEEALKRVSREREEGEKSKAIEMARAMKKDKKSIEEIQKYTQLPIEEIEKL